MSTLIKPYFPEDYFSISTEKEFEELALKAFAYQYRTNTVYRAFCDYMKVTETAIRNIIDLPFLPIELFKEQKIISGDFAEDEDIFKKAGTIFRSSGTSGLARSKHYITDQNIYRSTLTEGFKRVFGDPGKYSFLALLPGYVERDDSSLIYMVNELMKNSTQKNNVFFKEAGPELIESVAFNQQHHIDTILFGVSFSLLEFAYKNPVSLEGIILIETGGMKGKMPARMNRSDGEEMTRAELHVILKEKFQIKQVYSEYGMTELLSQAYCKKNEEFELPPWMQVLIRETNDPKNYLPINKVGGINIIDLANINSCCFISTQDLGKKTSPNTFDVLGRFDNADIRGCNLLYPYGT